MSAAVFVCVDLDDRDGHPAAAFSSEADADLFANVRHLVVRELVLDACAPLVEEWRRSVQPWRVIHAAPSGSVHLTPGRGDEEWTSAAKLGVVKLPDGTYGGGNWTAFVMAETAEEALQLGNAAIRAAQGQ